MKICQTHWALCRTAVDERGLGGLVASDGREAVERLKDEMQGAAARDTFDPLMSLNTHYTGEALRCGGLYLMGRNETGENDGHYCPICEFEAHSDSFDAAEAIGEIADQMAEWARSEGLVPPIS